MKKVSELLLASSYLKSEVPGKSVVPKKNREAYALKLSRLFEAGIGMGSVTSYSQMASEVYGDDSTPEGTLSSFASRYRKKALDEIAFIDFKPALRNEYNRARYEVQRGNLVADLFYVKGKSIISIHLWRKSLALARKHGFTLEAYHCATRLCYQYAFRRRKTEHYNMRRMCNRLLQHTIAEREAKALNERVVLLMKDKMYFPATFSRTSRIAFMRTHELAVKYKTPELWLTTFRTKIYHHYICHDYKGLLRTCRAYRNFLLRNSHLQQDSRWADIAIHEMNASLSLRHFSYGIRRAEENSKYMRPENTNWLVYRENYFRLLIHAQEYTKAQQLYQEVMNSPHRKKMNAYDEDVWKINLAYLHFALYDSNQISRFMPVRFFNRLRQIKTEKEGYNFLIQAGLVLYLLAQKRSADLAEFGDNFRKYVQRHIDRRKHYRTYYFSLLLLILFKYHQDIGKAESIGKKFHDKLLDFHGRSPHDREITELIPYDHLWLMILRLMKQQ